MTLRKRPTDYTGSQRYRGCCVVCKSMLVIDKYRSSGRENSKNRCNCDGYPSIKKREGSGFTHRKGSLFCQHGAAGRVGFTFLDRGTDAFGRWLEAGRPVQWEFVTGREMSAEEIEAILTADSF